MQHLKFILVFIAIIYYGNAIVACISIVCKEVFEKRKLTGWQIAKCFLIPGYGLSV